MKLQYTCSCGRSVPTGKLQESTRHLFGAGDAFFNNPNSMKLNLDEQLGSAVTFNSTDYAAAAWVQRRLQIPGLQSVFVCRDFITLNKVPRAH
jgi:hypothetical protein